jgi:hypothetical protein
MAKSIGMAKSKKPREFGPEASALRVGMGMGIPPNAETEYSRFCAVSHYPISGNPQDRGGCCSGNGRQRSVRALVIDYASI